MAKAGLPEDRLLGQFFLSEAELSSEDQIINTICGKLFIYLWDDVLRHGMRKLIYDIGQLSSFNEIVEGFKQGDLIFSETLNRLLLPE